MKFEKDKNSKEAKILKPFIVPIPGTTKWAHLQENYDASSYQFNSDELKTLTAELNKIKIVGERAVGQQAQQINN